MSAQVQTMVSVRPRPAAATEATVTVVIPCYNYARYLRQAVASVLSQAAVSVDVIIVDDASTDDSLALARELASRHRSVSVIAHAYNTGPVETFNDGLARASGEFLARLDADDLLTPGCLKRAVDVMRAYPSVGLVYGHPLHFTGDLMPAARSEATRWTVWPGRHWLADRCRFGVNVITSPEVLMRKSVVDQVGGQLPLAHTHDMEMWLRMSAFCDVGYVHGVDQAWHREHAESLSARHVDAFRDLIERRDAFLALFAGCAADIPDASAMRIDAMRAIATDAVELASRQYDHPTADPEMVERLRGVASSLVPDVRTLHGWTGLEKRMAMGAKRACRHPPFFAERIVRGLLGIYRRRRWHRSGL